ncbi:hypothetical protein SAMD00019534_070450 [Acytostelium subglobosum LB1]|uniref:hypothetical protein n=1 Tax=Acytostelium subglobosum LB1 TaxID=1410327 RepID=UPI0006448D3B|nr:hypothetical protein SAMD00019534_070450 [Acytostelium subglobosum LB1]GAM23870.1 hypothetical protein SAMD00019534_070450 [Acytostelium subglobosum LB1]|eukprot:XP_012752906.1 hypothetical protein SAMD00019534_070450 [Acytostelium subglobosum LB1]
MEPFTDDIYIKTIDYIEFWVGNAKSFIKCFLQPLNYHPVAIRRTEKRVQFLLVNSPQLAYFKIIDGAHLESTCFIVTAATSELDTEFHNMRQAHNGDFIKSIAFNCTDVDLCFDRAVAGGAKPVQQPCSPFQSIRTATITSPFFDVDHVFIRRTLQLTQHQIHNPLMLFPDFVELSRTMPNTFSKTQMPSAPTTLSLDHVATCVKNGQLMECIKWYNQCLGFKLMEIIKDGDVPRDNDDQKLIESENYFNVSVGEDIGLRMAVISNQPASMVTFTLPSIMWVISEAAVGGKGQVEQFVKFNGGSGIQHLAFLTNDIFKAVDYARHNLMEFIEAPDYYYNNLSKREELKKVLSHMDMTVIDDLKTHKVLLDSENSSAPDAKESYILQIFTKPICDTPTFFFEVISRENALGFGKGNIKALFEAVEMSQHRELNEIREVPRE